MKLSVNWMERAIAKNRFRQERFRKGERKLRALRQRIFDYDDEGNGKGEKASRLIARIKVRLTPCWEARAKDVESQNIHHILVSRGAD